MDGLLVLVLAVGLVSADIGLGYNYKPPPSFPSYGTPIYQTSGSSGQYNTDYNHANAFNYKFSNQNGYQSPSFGFQNSANNVYRGNGGYQGFNPAIIKGDTLGTHSVFQNTINKPQGIYYGGNIYKETAAYQGENVGSYGNVNGFNKGQISQNNYILKPQPPQVFKHFYVHAAPEEEEPLKPRTPVVLPPPQKHYKIIFIKAPTQLTNTPQFIPVPQQNEEKTIVYVLVNKPEETQDILLPKIEQKPPAKPEVYFIKYNNKEGSQAVIENIVKDHNNGQSVSFTNVGTGVAPPPPFLFGTLGASGTQAINSASVGSSGLQNTVTSGFDALSTQFQAEQGSGSGSNPLSLSTSGGSDGTLASTIVDTGTAAISKVDNEHSSSSSSTGFNGASSSSGFNGVSSNAVINGASSSAGINSALSSTGLSSTSSTSLNGESGNTAFNTANESGFNSGGSTENAYNSAPSTNEFSSNNGIPLASSSFTDSEYNLSTISTSQGVPHETYGIPNFRI